MYYKQTYDSPIGPIRLVADEGSLISLALPGQRPFIGNEDPIKADGEHTAITMTVAWLETYFQGKDPGFLPPVRLTGTEYQKAVFRKLLEIPFGETVSYKEIAVRLAEERGTKPAPHPVGQAVGSNPIPLIIPCHRVVGADGNLTGYNGGIDKKVWLLEHEGADMSRLKVPRTRAQT